MYEVNDLFEAGEAGATIQGKVTDAPDELSGLFGPISDVYEEE